MVDALVSGGDEGRGKLRKASGSGKHALIRRYPNGATPPTTKCTLVIDPQYASVWWIDRTRVCIWWWGPCAEYIGVWGDTQGSETSQYLEEKKSTEIP